jgi:hypothetical protein
MVTANITFEQSATGPGPGISMVGVGGLLVSVSNADDTGAVAWEWELLDSPLNSALVPGSLGTSATASFTPDTPETPGCYRVKLTVQGADGAVACDVKNFAVPTAQGWILPPFKATAAELNFPGNEEGWESLLNEIFLSISGGGSDEQVKVTGADTTTGVLNAKVAAGANVSLAVLNPGASEQLEVTAVNPQAVADIAGLGAVSTASVDDGAIFQVNSLKAPWRLDKLDTTTTVDGITVISTDLGARWKRQDTVDLFWCEQPTYYVNATGGNDEADGLTTGTALRTFGEWRRRVESVGVRATMTVFIETDLPASDPVGCTRGRKTLTIQGVPVVQYSGTVNTYTVNAAANIPYQINDPGITPASYLHQLVRFTGGYASGFVTVLNADLGGNSFRMPPVLDIFGLFAFDDFTLPGDTYDVELCPEITFDDDFFYPARLDLTQLRFTNDFPDQSVISAAIIRLESCGGGGLFLFAADEVYVFNHLYGNITTTGKMTISGGVFTRVILKGGAMDNFTPFIFDGDAPAWGQFNLGIDLSDGAIWAFSLDAWFYGSGPFPLFVDGSTEVRGVGSLRGDPNTGTGKLIRGGKAGLKYQVSKTAFLDTITEKRIQLGSTGDLLDLNNDLPYYDPTTGYRLGSAGTIATNEKIILVSGLEETNSASLVRVGAGILDTNDYSASFTYELVAAVECDSNSYELRLWDVTAGTYLTGSITGNNTSLEIKDLVITPGAGERIYELHARMVSGGGGAVFVRVPNAFIQVIEPTP